MDIIRGKVTAKDIEASLANSKPLSHATKGKQFYGDSEHCPICEALIRKGHKNPIFWGHSILMLNGEKYKLDNRAENTTNIRDCENVMGLPVDDAPFYFTLEKVVEA